MTRFKVLIGDTATLRDESFWPPTKEQQAVNNSVLRLRTPFLLNKCIHSCNALIISCDNINDCQRTVSTLYVTQHTHQITNMRKFKLNLSL